MASRTRARVARLEARVPHAGEALIVATEAAETFLSPALRARREALLDLLESGSPDWSRLDSAAAHMADRYAPGMAAWCERMDALTIPAGTRWSSPSWRRALPKPPIVDAEAVRRAAAAAETAAEGEQRDALLLCAIALGQAFALPRDARAWLVQ